MNEPRLLFNEEDAPGVGRFTVRLEKHDGESVGQPVEFRPFLSQDDFEDLRWYLEDFLDLPDGGSVVRAGRIEGCLAEWGRRLHDDVFSLPANRAVLAGLLAGPEPRVLTIGTDDPRLLRLPWELIADQAGSLSPRVSVRRQLEKPEERETRQVQLPLRILYLVCRPADTGFIDPRLTSKSMFDALDPLGASVRVDFCRPPTLARMEQMLSDARHQGDPYDVLHFDGHGTFIPQLQVPAAKTAACLDAQRWTHHFRGLIETVRRSFRKKCAPVHTNPPQFLASW